MLILMLYRSIAKCSEIESRENIPIYAFHLKFIPETSSEFIEFIFKTNFLFILDLNKDDTRNLIKKPEWIKNPHYVYNVFRNNIIKKIMSKKIFNDTNINLKQEFLIYFSDDFTAHKKMLNLFIEKWKNNKLKPRSAKSFNTATICEMIYEIFSNTLNLNIKYAFMKYVFNGSTDIFTLSSDIKQKDLTTNKSGEKNEYAENLSELVPKVDYENVKNIEMSRFNQLFSYIKTQHFKAIYIAETNFGTVFSTYMCSKIYANIECKEKALLTDKFIREVILHSATIFLIEFFLSELNEYRDIILFEEKNIDYNLEITFIKHIFENEKIFISQVLIYKDVNMKFLDFYIEVVEACNRFITFTLFYIIYDILSPEETNLKKFLGIIKKVDYCNLLITIINIPELDFSSDHLKTLDDVCEKIDSFGGHIDSLEKKTVFIKHIPIFFINRNVITNLF